MVAEFLVLVDRHGPGGGGDARGGDVVVDAPADVLGIGLAAVAPPGVATVRFFRVQHTVGVHPTTLLNHIANPGTFLGCEAAVL